MGASISSTGLFEDDVRAAFLQACLRGNLQHVKPFIQNKLIADINEPEPMGDLSNALIKAAVHNHPDVVKFLLESKADPNYRTKSGMTALMTARNDCVDVITSLLDKGADTAIENKVGDTALILAVDAEAYLTIPLLIKAMHSQRVSLHSLNRKGICALTIALSRGVGNKQLITDLVESDVNIPVKPVVKALAEIHAPTVTRIVTDALLEVKSNDVALWTPGQVAAWVHNIVAESDPQCFLKAARMAVSGEDFLELDLSPELLNEWGVSTVTSSQNVMKHFKDLKSKSIQGRAEARHAIENEVDMDFKDLTFGKKIGSGFSSTVYKGTWKNADVVIKEMRTNMSSESIEVMKQEAALNKKLGRHPHVCGYIGSCYVAPNFYLVTEYLPSGSVEKVLMQEKRFSSPSEMVKVVQMAVDAASGLSHLHSEKPEQVIHRDMAARNLLLDSQFRVRVCDFGMARWKDTNLEFAESKDTVGPVRWMAPEALTHHLFGEKSDVWSFGVTLYEMFAREVPFKDMKPVEAARHVLRGGRLTPPGPDRCPELIANIMKDCWQKDPNQRPRMDEVYARLKDALNHLTKRSQSVHEYGSYVDFAKEAQLAQEQAAREAELLEE